MVKDSGDALLDAVDIQRIGAGAGAVHHQLAVDGPPCAIQHLVEIGGVVAHDGEAPGQSGIDVGVGVDEGRHDHAAFGVNDLGIGVFGPQRGFFANLGDETAFKGHGAAFIIAAALAVAGDESAVGDQIHGSSSFSR